MNTIVSLLVSGFLLFCATGTEALAGPNEDIIAAAKLGDKAAVETAINNGASVNAFDPLAMPGETTALGIAAANGHENVAKSLLDHGANVSGRDGLQLTPLHMAADHGNHSVAKLLLAHAADVNARDFLGATPLHYAATG